jgi:glycogen synthase
VQEFIPADKTGNGFVFWNYDAGDFSFSINRALSVYYSDDLDIARRNAMNADYSSTRSAEKYIECFGWAKEKYR